MDQQLISDQTAETCYFTESSLVCYPLREEERVRLHASAGAKNLAPNILGSCSWPYYPPASLRCFNIILSLLCSAGFFFNIRESRYLEYLSGVKRVSVSYC